jgi:hypothetical protein
VNSTCRDARGIPATAAVVPLGEGPPPLEMLAAPSIRLIVSVNFELSIASQRPPASWSSRHAFRRARKTINCINVYACPADIKPSSSLETTWAWPVFIVCPGKLCHERAVMLVGAREIRGLRPEWEWRGCRLVGIIEIEIIVINPTSHTSAATNGSADY